MEEIDRLAGSWPKDHRLSVQKESRNSEGRRNTPERPSVKNQLFFRRYLREQSKRFSKNIISNSFICKKETFMKLLILHLEIKPEERSSHEIEATAKVLSEQNVFPQFNNDIKVLRLMAKDMMMVYFEPGDVIYAQNQKDPNMYKIIEGVANISTEVSVRQSFSKNKHSALEYSRFNVRNSVETEQNSIKQNIRKSRSNITSPNYNSKSLKEKGEFLEDMLRFKLVKDAEAVAVKQCYLLKIEHSHYIRILNVYLYNKVIIRMLMISPVFKEFTQKQIQSLIEKCDEVTLCHSQYQFKEGEFINESNSEKSMYFIIEGQIAILKRYHGKQQIVCVVNDGSFIGEEVVFMQDVIKRKYTAKVKSLGAKVLSIKSKQFQEWLKNHGYNFEAFADRYRVGLKQKLEHYDNYLSRSNVIKESVFAQVANSCLNESKREKLKNISNIVGKIEQKVLNLEKIKAKRLNFNSCSHDVSFEEPLFTRKDFPEMINILKRFQNQENKAIQRFNKIKSIQ